MLIARSILLDLLVILLVNGCAAWTDYTNPDNVDIRSFEPVGQEEALVIAQNTRVVRNCGGVSAPNEMLEVQAATEIGVEWQIGEDHGTGFTIDKPLPATVDLTSAFSQLMLMQIKSATASQASQQLAADSNSVVEYFYQAIETWQPGTVVIMFRYLKTVTIQMKYRTGMKVEIREIQKGSLFGQPNPTFKDLSTIMGDSEQSLPRDFFFLTKTP